MRKQKEWNKEKNKYTKKKVKTIKLNFIHKNYYRTIKMTGRDFQIAVGNIPYMKDETLHNRLHSSHRERYLNTEQGYKLMMEGSDRYLSSLEA